MKHVLDVINKPSKLFAAPTGNPDSTTTVPALQYASFAFVITIPPACLYCIHKLCWSFSSFSAVPFPVSSSLRTLFFPLHKVTPQTIDLGEILKTNKCIYYVKSLHSQSSFVVGLQHSSFHASTFRIYMNEPQTTGHKDSKSEEMYTRLNFFSIYILMRKSIEFTDSLHLTDLLIDW